MDRHYLRLSGLDPNLLYQEQSSGRILRGDTLINAGIVIPEKLHDYDARISHFMAVEKD